MLLVVANHPGIAGTVSVLISSVAAWLDLIVCKPPQDPLWVILFTALKKRPGGAQTFGFSSDFPGCCYL